MKILTLSFSNLNSLKGDWHIDFTHDDFADNGIFAITGQTGAGKTTILDAICLAIYGQTPRIKTISNTQNDLMSTGTGECSSEVTLLINKKMYRFSWQQRRAGKKSDGKLQAIKREISEIKYPTDTNGKILESKLSLCEKKTLEIMHMNFEQFTRSVMLAQGNFSAFLQAHANEKGEILEQITGTEIYGKISIKTHEIAKQKRESLATLEDRLGDIAIMNDEEYTNLQATIQSEEVRLEKKQDHLQEIDKKIKLIENKNYYVEKIHTAKQDLSSIQKQSSDFEPNRVILEKANKAFEVEPLYQALLTIKAEEIKLNTHLDELKTQEPITVRGCQLAKEARHNADVELKNAKKIHDEALPLFQKVRELDSHIQQKNTTIHHISSDKINTENNLNTIVSDIDTLNQEIQIKKESLVDTDNTLAQLGNCDNLSQDIGILQGYQNHLIHSFHQYNDTCQKITNDSHTLKTLNQEVIKKREEYTKSKTAIKELDTAYQDTLYQMSTILNLSNNEYQEREITNAGMLLQNSLYQYEQLKTTLNHLKQYINEQKSIAQHLENSKTALHQKTDEQSCLTAKKDQLDTELTEEKRILTELQKAQLLQQELHVLKQHFDKLTEGEPCPLCGSNEHPYKAYHVQNNTEASDVNSTHNENTIAIHHTQEKINTLEQILNEYKQNIWMIDTDITNLNKDIQQYQHSLDNTKNTIHEQTSIVQQMMNELNINHLYESTDIDNTIHKINTNVQTIKDDCQRYQVICDTLPALKDELAHTQKHVQNIVDEGKELNHQCTIITNNINQYNEHIHHYKYEMLSTIRHLDEIIFSYTHIHLCANIDKIDDTLLTDTNMVDELIKNSESYIHRLINTNHQYKEHLKNQQLLIQDISNKQTQINSLINQKNHAAKKLSELSEELSKYQKDIDEVMLERQEYFGDKDVDNEQHILRTRLDENGQKYQNAVQHFNQVEMTHHHLQEKISQTEQSILSYHNDIQQKSQAFETALSNSGFVDTEAFLQAKISTEQRTLLNNQYQKISDELNKQTALLTQWQKELGNLTKNHDDTDKLDYTALMNEKDCEQESIHHILQNLGKQKQSREYAKENRNKHQALIEKINHQKSELATWLKLNELIGSADGKKYRNFVQGLTLELMLYHANQILQKMSERYILKHDRDSNKTQLEISVIDTAQGNELRSTKNLSGGESFIISLALAMGLSQMSSENIRIDSLFLDEGFGTLDDEILDIALSTLSMLQAEGKMIGIISHVASLKERIPTQIVIKKIANGASTLSGAGTTSAQVS